MENPVDLVLLDMDSVEACKKFPPLKVNCSYDKTVQLKPGSLAKYFCSPFGFHKILL